MHRTTFQAHSPRLMNKQRLLQASRALSPLLAAGLVREGINHKSERGKMFGDRRKYQEIVESETPVGNDCLKRSAACGQLNSPAVSTHTRQIDEKQAWAHTTRAAAMKLLLAQHARLVVLRLKRLMEEVYRRWPTPVDRPYHAPSHSPTHDRIYTLDSTKCSQ